MRPRSPARPAARAPSGSGSHLGVQFHHEVTPAVVDDGIRSDSARLAELGIDPATIRAQANGQAAHAAERAFELFDAWRALASRADAPA